VGLPVGGDRKQDAEGVAVGHGIPLKIPLC
jgi:hypothetical protein